MVDALHRRRRSLLTQRFVHLHDPQLAVAASLLIAVASGLTWMVARQPAATTAAASASEPVIQAYGVPDDTTDGQVVQANFADAQFNAAVDRPRKDSSRRT